MTVSAPKLNPIEYRWDCLKRNMLPPFCPADLHQLHTETWFQTLRPAARDKLHRTSLDDTGLPFRRPP